MILCSKITNINFCHINKMTMFNSLVKLTIISTFIDVALCTINGICRLEPSTNTTDHLNALSRLSSLMNKSWETDEFTVNICKDPKGVYDTKIGTVYGRTNCTHAVQADRWVLLEYRLGDPQTSQTCTGNTSSRIFIICDNEVNGEKIKVIDKSDCTLHFELRTGAICPAVETSPGKIFFIVIIVLFLLYFLIGIMYRRIVHSVRGCQQLPHLSFWSKIGSLLADCCNSTCRCEEEEQRADVWVEDRDDVLLRP